MWKKLKKLGGMVAGKGDKAEQTITAGAGNNRRDEHKAAADPQAPTAMRTSMPPLAPHCDGGAVA